MNWLNKTAYIFFFSALFCGTVAAQGGLPTETVDVIKNFDARLADAVRVQLKPELPALDTTTKRQAYNITAKTLRVEYLPPKIRPLSMKGDDVPKGYKGFARLGAGLPGAFYGEGSYHVFANKQFDMGINLLHHSANNSNKVENQRFSNNHAGLDATYFFEQGFAINGKLGYTRDVVHFYGYNDLNEELDTTRFSFEPEDIRQRFSIFDVSAKLFNGERTAADFNYNVGFDLYNLQDSYSARENGFDLRLEATKWFNEQNDLRVGLRTDFTSYRDTAKQSLNNFYLTPSFTIHGERFKVKLGAVVASHEDEFSFFPDIEAGANIVEGVVGIFVGAEGSLQKNTFRSLSTYNPFISSRIEVANTKYYHFYGGLKGEVSGVGYNAQVGYKSADDMALFLLNGQNDSIARFDVLYDTVNIVNIKVAVSAPLFKGFELLGSVSQNIYSPKNEEKAWHLPALTVNVGAKYRTDDNKLMVKGDFFLENGVPYLDSNGEAQNLNALFDISLGAEYYISKNFGLFMQLNNLANNKRQRWQRYPVYGLNALFGITARF